MNSKNKNQNWLEQFNTWMSMLKPDIENALSSNVGRQVSVGIEDAREYNAAEISELFADETLVIEAGFSIAALGSWQFILERSFAAALIDLVNEGSAADGFDPNGHQQALSEIWQHVMDTCATSITTIIGAEIAANAPATALDSAEIIENLAGYSGMKWDIDIEDLGAGQVLLLTPDEFSSVFESIEPDISIPEPGPMPNTEPPEASGIEVEEESLPGNGQPVVKPVVFEDLGPSVHQADTNEARNIDILMDVSLPITIELGRTRMLIKDVLELGAGSVIELDKLSGEPVDLYVNDKLFAKGEVVVIEENFGVRITELVKIDERLKALQ